MALEFDWDDVETPKSDELEFDWSDVPAPKPKNRTQSLLDQMRDAIAAQESGSNYNVRPNGRTGALGMYQVLPGNVPVWTQKHLGKRLTPEQFAKDPDAQDRVFNAEMGSYLERAQQLNPDADDDTIQRMGAAGWYAGPGKMDRHNDRKRFRPNEPSIGEYADIMLKGRGKTAKAATPSSVKPITKNAKPGTVGEYINQNQDTPTHTRTGLSPSAIQHYQRTGQQSVIDQHNADTDLEFDWSDVEQTPVPESPATLNAQVKSAQNPDSPKAAVLVTPGEKQPKAKGLKPVPTDKGTLLVNPSKPQADMDTMLGTVDPVKDTSQGMAVVAVDEKGREVEAKIVTTPEAAKAQMDVNAAMHPNTEQLIMDAQEAVQARLSNTKTFSPEVVRGAMARADQIKRAEQRAANQQRVAQRNAQIRAARRPQQQSQQQQPAMVAPWRRPSIPAPTQGPTMDLMGQRTPMERMAVQAQTNELQRPRTKIDPIMRERSNYREPLPAQIAYEPNTFTGLGGPRTSPQTNPQEEQLAQAAGLPNAGTARQLSQGIEARRSEIRQQLSNGQMHRSQQGYLPSAVTPENLDAEVDYRLGQEQETARTALKVLATATPEERKAMREAADYAVSQGRIGRDTNIALSGWMADTDLKAAGILTFLAQAGGLLQGKLPDGDIDIGGLRKQGFLRKEAIDEVMRQAPPDALDNAIMMGVRLLPDIAVLAATSKLPIGKAGGAVRGASTFGLPTVAQGYGEQRPTGEIVKSGAEHAATGALFGATHKLPVGQRALAVAGGTAGIAQAGGRTATPEEVLTNTAFAVGLRGIKQLRQLPETVLRQRGFEPYTIRSESGKVATVYAKESKNKGITYARPIRETKVPEGRPEQVVPEAVFDRLVPKHGVRRVEGQRPDAAPDPKLLGAKPVEAQPAPVAEKPVAVKPAPSAPVVEPVKSTSPTAKDSPLAKGSAVEIGGKPQTVMDVVGDEVFVKDSSGREMKVPASAVKPLVEQQVEPLVEQPKPAPPRRGRLARGLVEEVSEAVADPKAPVRLADVQKEAERRLAEKESQRASVEPVTDTPAITYNAGEKYHQKVPEITRISPANLRRMNSDEVAEVSPEVAAKMDFSEPIEVTVFADGEMRITDGHHRVAAAKQLGLPSLPVRVQATNAKGETLQRLIADSAQLKPTPAAPAREPQQSAKEPVADADIERRKKHAEWMKPVREREAREDAVDEWVRNSDTLGEIHEELYEANPRFRKLIDKGDKSEADEPDEYKAADKILIAEYVKRGNELPLDVAAKYGFSAQPATTRTRAAQAKRAAKPDTVAPTLAPGAVVAAAKRVNPAQRTRTAQAAKPRAGGLKMVPAWHGSPHVFDKFSMDKLGTGEGAQAYGHGLYFTDKESIADYYREALTDPQDIPLALNGKPLNEVWTQGLRERFPEVYKGLSEDDTNTLDGILADLSGVKSLADAERYFGRDRERYPLFKRLVKGGLTKPELGKGAKYEVELAPENDEFLLWDKPLSEQSDKVQRAFLDVKDARPFGAESDGWKGAPKGLREKNLLSKTGAELQRQAVALTGNPQKASEYLHSLGIRGIKFLDGSSRSKGEGAFNYVIFNDADVSIKNILKKKSDFDDTTQAELDRVNDLTQAELKKEATATRDAAQVYLNPAGFEAVARVRENLAGIKDGDVSPEQAFQGITLSPKQVDEHIAGLRKYGFKDLAQTIEDAKNEAGHAELILTPDAVAHEDFHGSTLAASNYAEPSQTLSPEDFTSLVQTPAVKAWKKQYQFDPEYRNAPDWLAVHETAATLAQPSNELGLSVPEQDSFLATFAQAFVKRNGIAGIEKRFQRQEKNVKEIINAAAKAYEAESRIAESNRSSGSARTSGEASSATGSSSRNNGPPAEKAAKERPRGFLENLNEKGYGVAPENYTVKPQTQTEKDAQARIAQYDQTAAEALSLHPGELRDVDVRTVQLILHKLGRERRKILKTEPERAAAIAQHMNELSSQMAARMTEAGRANSAGQMLDYLDPDVVEIKATQNKKKGKKDDDAKLTESESKTVREKAEELEAQRNKIDELEAKIAKLQAKHTRVPVKEVRARSISLITQSIDELLAQVRAKTPGLKMAAPSIDPKVQIGALRLIRDRLNETDWKAAMGKDFPKEDLDALYEASKSLRDKTIQGLTPTQARITQKAADPQVLSTALRFTEPNSPGRAGMTQWVRKEFGLNPTEANAVVLKAFEAYREARREIAKEKLEARGLTEQAQEELKIVKRSAAKSRRELTLALDALARPQPGVVARVNNIFRGLIVSQLATSMRNLTTQQPNVGVDALATMLEAGINKAQHKAGLNLFPSNLDPNMRVLDAMLPVVRLFQRNKALAENVLNEDPHQFERLFSLHLAQADLETKNFGDILAKVEKGVTLLNTVNRMQELFTRRAVFLGKLEAQMNAKGMDLREMDRKGELDKIPPEMLKSAVEDALRVTFAADPQSAAAKVMVNGLASIPAPINPLTFARFMYNATKFVVDYNPLQLSRLVLNAGQGAGRVVNPKLNVRGTLDAAGIAKALVGGLLLLMADQVVEEFGGDDDKWYTLKLPKVGWIDIRAYYPFSAFVYQAHIVRSTMEGRSLPTWDENTEGLLGVGSYPNAAWELLKELPGALNGDDTRQEKAWKQGYKLAGNTLGGFLTPLKTAKDIIAGFDDRENIIKDYSDQPFMGPIKARVPFASRIWESDPEKEDVVTGEPLRGAGPLLNQLTGMKRMPENLLRDKLTPATEYAIELFQEQEGIRVKTDEEKRTSAIIGQLISAGQQGLPIETRIAQFVRKGILSEKQADFIRKAGSTTRLESVITRLTIERALKVYRKMDSNERHLVSQEMGLKVHNAMEKGVEPEVAIQIRQLGLEPKKRTRRR